MQVIIDGKVRNFKKGAKWTSLVRSRKVLGIHYKGKTLFLNSEVIENAEVSTLTLKDEEGRRIYERSLQYVFLVAARRLYPGKKVRIEHSFGEALYMTFQGVTMSWQAVRRLEEEMRKITDANMPINFFETTKDEALKYYEEAGEYDKLSLLKYRNYPTFHFYELDGMKEYFYGVMVPSTKYVDVFKLRLYLPGVLMLKPTKNHPDQPSEYKDSPKLMKAYSETAKWNSILECQNAADINEMMEKNSFREFIRINEELHSRSINDIAMEFLNSGARLICIAGPSSSGKTTFANRLKISLRCLGLHPVTLSLDDYYLDRDTLPREPDGSIDLERIDTLDLPLLDDHLVRLLQGEEVDVPLFDFVVSKRSDKTHKLKVAEDQPLIIEGIHGLNDDLCPSVPRDMKFKIYTSALTMVNLDDHNRIRTTDARLLRRIVRDYQFRGSSPEETLSMWASVRAGEEKYIFPYQEQADIIFNSTLAYEIPVLKKFAFKMLSEIPADNPYYTIARRLVKFMNYFYTIDVNDEIPLNSILREFVGGSCFYKEVPAFKISGKDLN